MARPQKVINQELFEQLCGLQCTQEEICEWFDVCTETLNAWCKRTYYVCFSEVFDKKRKKGKISLRRAQFRLAEKNAAMAIWLGKQYLNQRDVQDIVHAGEIKATVNTPIDMSSLSDEELEQFLGLMERIKGTEGADAK